jgi:hypothetical protein
LIEIMTLSGLDSHVRPALILTKTRDGAVPVHRHKGCLEGGRIEAAIARSAAALMIGRSLLTARIRLRYGGFIDLTSDFLMTALTMPTTMGQIYAALKRAYHGNHVPCGNRHAHLRSVGPRDLARSACALLLTATIVKRMAG